MLYTTHKMHSTQENLAAMVSNQLNFWAGFREVNLSVKFQSLCERQNQLIITVSIKIAPKQVMFM